MAYSLPPFIRRGFAFFLKAGRRKTGYGKSF